MKHRLLWLCVFLSSTIRILADEPKEPPRAIAPFFKPPAEFAHNLGAYKSPLTFSDGTPVKRPADWPRRRKQILTTWHGLMGAWPALLAKPTIEYQKKERRDNFTQHHVKIEVAPRRFTDDAYLLIPDGKGPFPAVLVVFYDAKTGIGQGKATLCDFALQLTKRGFVTLSLGSAPASYYPDKADAQLKKTAAQADADRADRDAPRSAGSCHASMRYDGSGWRVAGGGPARL